MKPIKATKSPAPSTNGSGKKLVQARLPFKKLATPTNPLAAPSTDEARKRKLSNTGNDDVNSRASKITRTENSTSAKNTTVLTPIVASISLVDSDDEVMKSNNSKGVAHPVKEETENVIPIVMESAADALPNVQDTTENVVSVEDTPTKIQATASKDDNNSISGSNDDSVQTPKTSVSKKKSKTKKHHHKEKKLVWDEDDANDATKSEPCPVLIKIPLPRKRKLSTKKSETVKSVKVDEEINNDSDKTVSLSSSAALDDIVTVTTEEVVNSNENTDAVKQEDNSIGDKSDKTDKDLNLIGLETETKNICEKEHVIGDDKEKKNKSDANVNGSIKCEPNIAQHVSNETEKVIEHGNEKSNDIEKNNDSEMNAATCEEIVKLDVLPSEAGQKVEQSSTNKPNSGENDTSNQSTVSVLSDDVNVIENPLTTPKRITAVSSSTTNILSTPTGQQKLTPKQLQRQKESEKKQLERQRAKEERDRKLQEEKEQKQRERDEKERLRRKEKEDREETKRREKEDRDRKRQAEIDAKNEERKRAAEQKEEERKKLAEQKEGERKKADEAKAKEKEKQKAAFSKFFVVKKTDGDVVNEKNEKNAVQQQAAFMPFQVKDDMKLAPIVRRKLTENRRNELDVLLKHSEDGGKRPMLEDLYVMNLRTGVRAPERDGKTRLTDDDDSSDVVMVYNDQNETEQLFEKPKPKQLYRAKFFKFEENRRPPYYGTWRKNSKLIKARAPFCTDKKFFDYDIDSDDEWEEEEPGESLNGSDDEKESVDDYDIDNEFFVPHGHLSDEELAKEDEIDEDNSPAAQKARLQIVQKEFADEMKKKTEKIKPRLIGLIWQTKDGKKPDACPPIIWDTLNARAMMYQGLCVLMCKPNKEISPDANDSDADDGTDSVKPIKRANITEDVVADLIRLIHGNVNNRNFLVNEFRAYLATKNGEESNFSVVSIRKKIKQLASYGPCPEEGFNKYCWYVSEEKRKQYDVMNLSMPNMWTYILKKSKKTTSESVPKDTTTEIVDQQPIDDSLVSKSLKTKSVAASGVLSANITKFTTVLTDDEKKKKFEIPDNPVASTSATVTPKPIAEIKPKKRVNLLLSVPRGEVIPDATKNEAVRKFLNDTNNQTDVKMAKTKSNGVGDIKKFTTKLTEEEKRKKFEISQSVVVEPPPLNTSAISTSDIKAAKPEDDVVCID